MAYKLSGFVLVLVIALFHSGSALRCWRCSSDIDPNCRDPFNITRLHQLNNNYFNVQPNPQYPQQQQNLMPDLTDCTSSNYLGQLYNQKVMCMKRVTTDPNGRQIIFRECKSVSADQQPGHCPSEPTRRGTTVDFCQYCDYDGCNSATGLTFNKILAFFLPVSLWMLVRH